ncbi:hypothetical protein ERC79_08345 [Rhodococcus sp. ABRD24]|uniref:hypothetical protein n=1 Tax=Rhodococcus sp. ABRD24 TaxID=2507582 RepID=UPI00103D0BB1|nr:hypothetical protein [Rhodococcus sp. ABRD24]QBJ95982.1 hypothetical protein ERC79_08345 [Rhodococcus sp. ABRD24]
MTVIGLIFVPLFLYCLAVDPRKFPWVLSACVPFPQTAALYISGSGVSPFYVGIIFLALHMMLRHLGIALYPAVNREDVGRRAPMVSFVLFATYSLLITAVGPWLFRGSPVFAARGGIDNQLGADGSSTELNYTISNAAQAVYLVLGIIIVAYFVRLNHVNPRIFELAIGIGLALAAARYALGSAWPADIFDNMPNIHYDVYGSRLRGTFAEPSVFGVFLGASVAYLVSALTRSRGAMTWAYIAALALALLEYVLSYSGTAFISLAVVGVIAVIAFAVRARATTGKLAGPVFVAACAIPVLVAVAWPALVDVTTGLTSQKLESESFFYRSQGDIESLRLFVDTIGLGLGLGSNRPSSLIVMMLSCVGVVGTVAFGVVLSRAIRGGLRMPAQRASVWALVATVVGQVAAKPDLAMPVMWLLLAICLHCWNKVKLASDTAFSTEFVAKQNSLLRE